VVEHALGEGTALIATDTAAESSAPALTHAGAAGSRGTDNGEFAPGGVAVAGDGSSGCAAPETHAGGAADGPQVRAIDPYARGGRGAIGEATVPGTRSASAEPVGPSAGGPGGDGSAASTGDSAADGRVTTEAVAIGGNGAITAVALNRGPYFAGAVASRVATASMTTGERWDAPPAVRSSSATGWTAPPATLRSPRFRRPGRLVAASAARAARSA
jgi:hypothetical protein